MAIGYTGQGTINKSSMIIYKKVIRHRYFPLIIAPLILFSPIIFTGRALFWGTPSLQFIPWWDYAWETLLSGNIPLWNPYVGMGAPLIANYQSALFYPPYWFHLIFYLLGGVKWMAWAISLIVVFHLAWAGIGTSEVLKSLGINKLGQIVGGLAFSMSGYLISRAGFLSINAAVSWLPWILLFSKQLVKKKRNALSLMGLSVGMLLLAGHAQTAWYSLVLSGLWILFWSISSAVFNKNNKMIIVDIGRYLTAILVGVGISAIQIIPTLEYLRQSSRSLEYGFTEAMTYSFWPWRFLTLLVPDLFGNPGRGNYWGYGNYWEDALYVGILPIVMALVVILRQGYKMKNRDRSSHSDFALVLLLLGIIVVGFLFALGKNTPIFPFLYHNVPTFDLFQAPTRFTIWVEISLALLAGMGIDKLNKPKGRGIYWTRLGVAGCIAGFLSAALASIFLKDIKTTFISSVATASAIGAVTALLVLFQPSRDNLKKHDLWKKLVVSFVVFDLVVAGWGLNPSVKMDFYEREILETSQSRSWISARDEYSLKFENLFRFDTFTPDIEWESIFAYLLPNAPLLENVKMANNFDPIVPASYQVWMEELNHQVSLKGSDDYSLQALDLMAVNRVSDIDGNNHRLIPNAISEPGELSVYYCADFYNDNRKILDLVMSEQVNTADILLIKGQNERSGECSFNVSKNIEIVNQDPGYLKVSLDLPQEGWLFWSQTWYPGWKVKVDGNGAGAPLKAQFMFQAALVPEGKHEVEFLYRPPTFFIGVVLTVLFLCLNIFILWNREK